MLVKIISNGYILGLAEAPTGVEVSEEEYLKLADIFHAMPTKEGYAYRLREDLTWEEYHVEPEPIEELTAEEIAAAIEEAMA